MNKKLVTLLFLLIFVFIGYWIGKNQAKEEVMVERKVYPFSLMDKSNYVCEAVNNVSTYEKTNYTDDNSLITLESNIETGTDKLSIEVDGEKFYLLTSAAVESGVVRSEEEWVVMRNDEKSLVAIWTNGPTDEKQTIDIFSLDKETSIAVWNRTRAQGFFTSDIPSGSIMHLKCM